MAEDPIKSAWCPLFFRAHGGRFDELGAPVWQVEYEDNASHIKGLCDEASECGTCSLLCEWVRHEQLMGYSAEWECDACVKATEYLPRLLAGFYHSGFCTRCGWETPLLQLVLRKG